MASSSSWEVTTEPSAKVMAKSGIRWPSLVPDATGGGTGSVGGAEVAVGASVGEAVGLTVWRAAGVGNNVAVGGGSVASVGAVSAARDGAGWAVASVGDTAAATGCAAGGAVAAKGAVAVYLARDSGWESEGVAVHAKRRQRVKTNAAIKSGTVLGEMGRAFLVGNGIIILTTIIAKGTLKYPGPTGERHAKPANWRN